MHPSDAVRGDAAVLWIALDAVGLPWHAPRARAKRQARREHGGALLPPATRHAAS